MLENIYKFITHLENNTSIELFALFGSFIEEIVAPIPSPLVMITAGSLAQAAYKSFYYLVLISMLSAIAKTFGSLIFYILADKGEHIVRTKFGHLIGVDGSNIKSIGKYFENKIHDDIIIALLRAFPLIPGTPVSLFCGLVKINIYTFTFSTLIGTFIRSLIFVTIGFYGTYNYQNILLLDKAEGFVNIILLLVFGILVGYLYKLKKQGKLENWLKSKLSN